MCPITFRAERAQRFFDCLLNGRPMLLTRNNWGEILQLAKACFFAVVAHGPKQTLATGQLRDWQREHPDHKEAEIKTLMHDLHVPVEFTAELTQLAYDGDYDEQYEALMRCGVQAVYTNVQISVVPVEGFKANDG